MGVLKNPGNEAPKKETKHNCPGAIGKNMQFLLIFSEAQRFHLYLLKVEGGMENFKRHHANFLVARQVGGKGRIDILVTGIGRYSSKPRAEPLLGWWTVPINKSIRKNIYKVGGKLRITR